MRTGGVKRIVSTVTAVSRPPAIGVKRAARTRSLPRSRMFSFSPTALGVRFRQDPETTSKTISLSSHGLSLLGPAKYPLGKTNHHRYAASS